MPISDAKPALLVLADGTAYSGSSFGAKGTAIGEVVFNTGMTGYQEVLTDPSYRGQMVVFTYPELGNTGVNPEDEESQRPQVRGAIARNICPRPSNWRAGKNKSQPLTVVAIDFGIKRNILRRLASYGCRVIVVPAHTPPEEILKYNPDGIFLSNGPGDPSAVTEGIQTTKALLLSQKPMFGICMGHQILGLSLGAETFKLKFGHRGLNQPAGLEQRVEITSQNHSFAIDVDSLPNADVEITHLNLNDSTVAGLKHKSLPFFSVQYHPEASPGTHDADYLFEQFVQEMRDAAGRGSEESISINSTTHESSLTPPA